MPKIAAVPSCLLLDRPNMEPISDYIEYQGAIHIHSTYSDGTGTMAEIIEAAQKAGLNYIILTDHDTLKPRMEGWEGWHDDLLVIVGVEVSNYRGHCIAMGVDRKVRKYRSLGRIIEDIDSQGGLSFIVHPHGRFRPIFHMRTNEWRNWEVNGYTGLEIWSYMFDWIKDYRYYKSREFYKNPEDQISGPSPETIRKWDELCQRNRVVAIGGVDAHAKTPGKIFKPLALLNLIKNIVVFPYEQIFRTIRTHILAEKPFSGDLQKDKQIVLGALRKGHCFLGYDALNSSTGFRFLAGEGDTIMGDDIHARKDIKMESILPCQASVRVVKDGEVVDTVETQRHSFTARTPGVYRIEAFLRGKSWIYSNPIYLRDARSSTPRFSSSVC